MRNVALQVKKEGRGKLRSRGQGALHLMLLPSVLLLLIFSYAPMLGLVMAFQNFVPAKGFFGSDWVAWANFEYVFNLPGLWSAIGNTLVISLSKIILGQVLAILLALMLNEMRKNAFTKSIQTVIYLPHFLSWVIVGGIFLDVLSYDGVVNQILQALGKDPIYFMGNASIFPAVVVGTHLWKEVGFATIIYLAALTNVDPGLYESAAMDGASRFRRIWHISLPAILPIIILVSVLNIGTVLDGGFEQILIMYNPMVYSTGDIIDTYIYRIGIEQTQYSIAAAVGIAKSAVCLLLVSSSYYAAHRFAGYRIF